VRSAEFSYFRKCTTASGLPPEALFLDGASNAPQAAELGLPLSQPKVDAPILIRETNSELYEHRSEEHEVMSPQAASPLNEQICLLDGVVAAVSQSERDCFACEGTGSFDVYAELSAAVVLVRGRIWRIGTIESTKCLMLAASHVCCEMAIT
jgi:hypothetical protein